MDEQEQTVTKMQTLGMLSDKEINVEETADQG